MYKDKGAFSNLNEQSNKILQPIQINIELKEHQKTAIYYMRELEKTNEIQCCEGYVDNYGLAFEKGEYKLKTRIGVFGDKVGAGKTLSCIGLINQKKLVEWRDITIQNTPYYSLIQKINPIRTNLIIVPAKIIHQWVKALLKTNLHFLKVNNIKNLIKKKEKNDSNSEEEDDKKNNDNNTPNIIPIDVKNDVYIDPIPAVANNDLWNNYKPVKPKKTIKIYKPEELIDLNEYDVVVVTDKKIKELVHYYPNIIWSRIIIDEIDSIILSRYSFDKLKFGFLWCVTATYNSVFKSSKPMLMRIFKNMDSYVFDNLLVKNSDAYVDSAMSLPKPKRYVVKCETLAEMKIVSEFVPPHIMAMINAGNLGEAIKELNCDEDTDENILQVIIKKYTNELELKTNELKFIKNQKNMPKAQRDGKIETLNKRITSLNTKIKTVQERIKSNSKDICQLCLQHFTKPCITPCCDTIFCFECLVHLTNQKCLICGEKFSLKSLKLINNDKNNITKNGKKENAEIKLLKNKFDTLSDILESTKGQRILIFSEYDTTFGKVETILNDLKIKYRELKGSVVNVIKMFEDSEINVLLLNAKYNGAGLNLHCADTVILFSRFSKEREEQAIGRAHRLGRKNPVNIYYLIHDGEFNQDLNNNQMDDVKFVYKKYSNKKNDEKNDSDSSSDDDTIKKSTLYNKSNNDDSNSNSSGDDSSSDDSSSDDSGSDDSSSDDSSSDGSKNDDSSGGELSDESNNKSYDTNSESSDEDIYERISNKKNKIKSV